MPADINIHIQYHSPDQAFAAVFVRDGEPWYLDGALVGMDSTPAEAVQSLLDIAEYLVVHGENFLVEHGENFLVDVTLPLGDRKWLFSLFDHWGDPDAVQEMYEAIRRAEEDEPYRIKTGRVLTEEDIERLADEAERGYDIQPCGFQWREAPQPGEEHDGPFVTRTCTLGTGHIKPVDHHDRNAPNATIPYRVEGGETEIDLT